MKVIEEHGGIEDALIGILYQAQNSKLYKRKLWMNRLVLTIVVFSVGYIYFSIGIIPSWSIYIVGLVSIAIFSFYPIRFKKINIRHYKKYLREKELKLGDSLTESDVYKLSDDNISILSNGIELSMKPERIAKFVELNTHLILFLKAGGTISFNKSSPNFKEFQNYFKSLDVAYQEDFNWKL